MKFVVHYQDGSTITESDMFWHQLPADKVITSLQLTLPHGGVLSLKGYDKYYFSQVMYSSLDSTTGLITEKFAKMVGGAHTKTGTVVEMEVDEDSNIKTERKPIDKCEIDRNLWRDGLNGSH